MSMLQRIAIAAQMVLALGAPGARAGQLPQYGVTGFPLTPLQMSVIRSGGIQEQPPAPALTLISIRSPSFDGSRSPTS